MPPKKVQEPERKPLIGRVGTNLKVGIVGVPNVGKSTFFNVLTKSAAAAENFPFCTIDPNENFYIRAPNDDLSDYQCDQVIISNKKHLKHISRIHYEEDDPIRQPQLIDWYPFTNSYYPYTEDVDAYARVNHLLGSKPSFESLTSIPDCNTTHHQDPYSEKGAQLQYLSSNPTSFLILGKPGIGEQELGKLLAEHWKCVYIDPETLINEEIRSGTRAGQCIEFNLRCGRAIGIDVLIRLIEKRIGSKSAQHRGFVLCGFPLIPNDLYQEDPVSSESAVFTAREIFEGICDTVAEVGVAPQVTFVAEVVMHGEDEEGGGGLGDDDAGDDEGEGGEAEEEPAEKTVEAPPQSDEVPFDVGSATASNICGPGDLGHNFEEQINLIFNQFNRPFVVVYIMCSNSDVVSKHEDTKFDFISKQLVDLQRQHSDKVVFTFFSTVPGTSRDEVPDDFMDVVKNNPMTIDSSIPVQLLRLPRDFPANMVALLDRYRFAALPVIERHILVHDPQYVIKVDGRISPIRMFSAVKTRLRVLPLQKVVVPEKLHVPPEPGGEGGPGDELNLDGLSMEECFEIFRRKQIASPMFKWGWSDWGTKCPVTMKEGSCKDGDPKLAVRFMNQVFFLADEDAYVKFHRNPRPYLQPPYPKPNCRIFVLGPRCSGKTAVARCLGFWLKGQVLEFDKLEKDYLRKRQDEYDEIIRNAALNEGMVVLNQKRRMEWQRQEEERVRKVEGWLQHQIGVLEEGVKLKQYVAEQEEDMELEMSSFPMTLAYNKKSQSLQIGSGTSLASMEAKKLRETVEELQQLIHIDRLPSLEDLILCEQLLANPDTLYEYLPPELEPPQSYTLEPATIFDDFVVEFAENAVSNVSYSGIELTLQHIVEMLLETLREVEERSQQEGNVKGGWIVDGIPAHEEIFRELLTAYVPEDVLVLRDLDGYEFLLKRFETRGSNQFRDYRGLFMDLDKPEAAWRSPSVKSTDSYKNKLVKDVLYDVLDESTTEKAATRPRKATLDAYERELEKFDEDWETLSTILADYKQTTISTIIVAGKSLDELLKSVVKSIEDRFRQQASLFTAEDRTQEVEDFGEPDMQGEDLGEGEEGEPTEDLFFQNRRFGDTFNYCPVTFHNHWVLWKGKEEFAAKFENKLYLTCSEDALYAFVDQPRQYLPATKPSRNFPSPRLCIVGAIGSGKTTVSNALSRNLGLYNRNYAKMICKAIAPKATLDLPEILKLGVAGEQGQMIEGYLVTDEPLPEEFLNSLISPLWFQDPIKLFGFVLDGFPRRPSDAEYMTEHSTIPDVVVELSITEDEVHKRLVEKFALNWQIALDQKKKILEDQRREILNTWQEQRNARFKELMELKKDERYVAKIKEKELQTPSVRDPAKKSRPYLEDLAETDEEKDLASGRAKSQISYDSVAEQADLEAVNLILEQEFPEPILEDEPDETLEEAVADFVGELEESFANDVNFLRLAREHCEAELIPWITVDAGMSSDKVFAQVMRVVDSYKFRNNSLFERVYDISVELADKLLSTGYYFLSKFGKTCPVQIRENTNPVQMFLPLEQKFRLFPVIHRQYIYFLAEKENRDKFKEHPLKYTTIKNCDFPLVPLRVAIIGPPKSGKSALANRYHRELGLKVISPGQAGRYVLKYLEFSELARNMDTVLRMGWELTSEMVTKSVEALAFDGRSITQGFVLDGFPSCIEQAHQLADMGLVPHLVIDLQADHADILKFLSTDVGKRGLPVFSSKLIDHRLGEWGQTANEFREWLDKEYQILAKVPVQPSKWGVWTQSCELTLAVFSEVTHYYKYAHCDVPLRLANMQITPMEFLERQSSYKHYCLCCLHYHNALVTSGQPPDRTGLVQFRKNYYYLCPAHIDVFVSDPEQFISPYNNHQLPEDLPVRVFVAETSMALYEDGFCIICYWENQPKLVLRKGTLTYAASYKHKLYMFDSLTCLDKFLRQPSQFYAKLINFKGKPYPLLDYHDLPTQGLLQQYDSRQLIRAIVNTGILRPVIPGLSPQVSACLNVGLHLKMNNPRTSGSFLPLYQEAQNLYHGRRLDLIAYLAQMKKVVNPYLYYDEPLPKFVDPLYLGDFQVQKEPDLGHVTGRSSSYGSSGSALDASAVVVEEIFNRIKFEDGPLGDG